MIRTFVFLPRFSVCPIYTFWTKLIWSHNPSRGPATSTTNPTDTSQVTMHNLHHPIIISTISMATTTSTIASASRISTRSSVETGECVNSCPADPAADKTRPTGKHETQLRRWESFKRCEWLLAVEMREVCTLLTPAWLLLSQLAYHCCIDHPRPFFITLVEQYFSPHQIRTQLNWIGLDANKPTGPKMYHFWPIKYASEREQWTFVDNVYWTAPAGSKMSMKCCLV